MFDVFKKRSNWTDYYAEYWKSDFNIIFPRYLLHVDGCPDEDEHARGVPRHRDRGSGRPPVQFLSPVVWRDVPGGRHLHHGGPLPGSQERQGGAGLQGWMNLPVAVQYQCSVASLWSAVIYRREDYSVLYFRQDVKLSPGIVTINWNNQLHLIV